MQSPNGYMSLKGSPILAHAENLLLLNTPFVFFYKDVFAHQGSGIK